MMSSEPWIDVSIPVKPGMIRWPGNPEVEVELHREDDE